MEAIYSLHQHRQRKHRSARYLVTASVAILAAAVGLLALGSAPAFASGPGDLDVSFSGDGVAHIKTNGAFQFGAFPLPNGKYIAFGHGPRNADQTDPYIVARFRANGHIDTKFGTNGITRVLVDQYDEPYAWAVQPNGKILIAGTAEPLAGGPFDGAIVRFDRNGQVDGTFGNHGVAQIYASDNPSDPNYDVDVTGMVLEPSGRIVAQVGHGQLMAFTPTGDPDMTFGAGGSVNVGGVLAGQAAGRLYLAGNDSIMRLNADGTPDSSWGSGGTLDISGVPSGISQIRVLADGAIVGWSDHTDGTQSVVAKFTASGAVDQSFAGGTVNVDGEIDQVAVDPLGRVVTAASGYGEPNDAWLMHRFNADGSLDTSFGRNGVSDLQFPEHGYTDYCFATCLWADPDGKIVAEVAAGARKPNPDREGIGLVRYLG